MTVTIAYTFAASSVSNPLAYLDTNFGQCVLWSGPTGTAQMPYGTTGQRDATPFIGIRYNTTLLLWEGYNGTTWGGLGTFGGGTVINPITAPGFTANTTAGVTFSDGSALANAAVVQSTFKNLHISGPGNTAAVSVTADSLVVKNSANGYATVYGCNISAATGFAAGLNSIDTGSWAYSTWYYVHVIYGTAGTGLVFSLSATAPTLPTGYTYSARVGAIRTQSASYNPFGYGWNQYGRRLEYVSNAGGGYPVMATGAYGTINSTTTTWVPSGVAAFAPPTASRFCPMLSCGSNGSYAYCAPNSTQTGGFGTNGFQPVLSNINSSAGVSLSVYGEFALESINIYYASASANNILMCIGYEDNL